MFLILYLEVSLVYKHIDVLPMLKMLVVQKLVLATPLIKVDQSRFRSRWYLSKSPTLGSSVVPSRNSSHVFSALFCVTGSSVSEELDRAIRMTMTIKRNIALFWHSHNCSHNLKCNILVLMKKVVCAYISGRLWQVKVG